MKKLFSVFVLTAALAMQADAQIKVTAEIDSAAILIGEQTAVRVQVVHPEKSQVVFPNDIAALLNNTRLEVVGNGEIEEHRNMPEKGLATSVFSFRVTSFEPSLYYIPQLSVTVGKKAYQTNQLALKVNDVEVDTLHTDKFYGPKEIIKPVYTWADWMPLFALSLLLIVCAGAMVYLLYLARSAKETKVTSVKKVPVLPHEEAKKKIERLKSEYDSSSFTSKDYYTALVSILRGYVTLRYGFSAEEMTSCELVERLVGITEENASRQTDDGSNNVSPAGVKNKARLEELREILNVADLTKFAKLQTEADEDRASLMRLADYVEATKNESQRVFCADKREEEDSVKRIKPRTVFRICLVALGVAVISIVFFMIKEVLELF